MAEYRKLWWLLIAILIVTFSILGYFGREVYRQAPPIPGQVISDSGDLLMTRDSILDGQTAWQSVGGMQLGSIWGHGAYQAPDWSADWLHRELVAWLEVAARDQFGKPFAALDEVSQDALRSRLKSEYRRNGYDEASGTVIVSAARAAAIRQTADYYSRLFSDAPELQGTRESYAMKEDTLPSAERRADLSAFFFWTAWTTATERPDSKATYTNNWPHEPLIGNVPTGENVLWSVISVVLLVAGVGALIWAWAFLRGEDGPMPAAPVNDPLTSFPLTPSQTALGK